MVSSLRWVAGHGFVTKEPKNRQRRWVPVSRSVLAEVVEMAGPVGGGHVWPSPEGAPLDHNNFCKRHSNRLCIAVPIAISRVRTYLCCVLTASGADLLTVSRRLGSRLFAPIRPSRGQAQPTSRRHDEGGVFAALT